MNDTQKQLAKLNRRRRLLIEKIRPVDRWQRRANRLGYARPPKDVMEATMPMRVELKAIRKQIRDIKRG